MSKNSIYVNEDSLEGILNVQLSTPLKVKGLESQDDVISFSISTMVMGLSNLVGVLSLNHLAKQEIDIKDVKKILSKFTKSLFYLCNAFNYDLPPLSEHDDFVNSIPVEISMSRALTCMDMMRAITDISYFVYVTHPGAIWAEAELPELFDTYLITLLWGVKNLSESFNIKISDLAI